MLVIRFFRVGKKNQPAFKIVVTDKRNSSTRGRFVEQVGTYNPKSKEKTLQVERVQYWLSVGAKPSPTVFNLLVSEKLVDSKKIPLQKKSKKVKEPEVQAPVATAPAAKPVEEKVAEQKPVQEPAVAVEKPAEEKKEETSVVD